MSLRPLTEQERAEALAKAAAARAARATAKDQLKSGTLSVADLLSSGDGDSAIARMKVSEMLEALPGIGRVRAAAIMDELGIALSRRLRGLGVHQRRALVDFMNEKQIHPNTVQRNM
ncbi:integration host factor, actinobacterial type [Arthrobacter sp. 24S4-2]|uniref:integration host factor, actinobacterial type n=1 Tax=Arthrobacter sp. 24S4-2 TaxID=2575374 RepID=UPI001585E691|nr:integration host factor, actinobacterial type [Arthrobacter sp. 24S4-2]